MTAPRQGHQVWSSGVVVDDYTMYWSSERAAELGLMNHTGKRKLVRGRATVAALENAGYEMNEIDIVDGTVFAGQLIVDPLSAGGQRFIEDF